jgi:hypothetical protein
VGGLNSTCQRIISLATITRSWMPTCSPILAPTSRTSTKTPSILDQDSEPYAAHWPTILYLFTVSDFKTIILPVVRNQPLDVWLSQ